MPEFNSGRPPNAAHTRTPPPEGHRHAPQNWEPLDVLLGILHRDGNFLIYHFEKLCKNPYFQAKSQATSGSNADS
jgi:hypothetical protein